MILPLKWLRDYIEIDISAEKFADQMTLTGTKSERVEHIGEAISGVVVGKITEITKHPDADKLITPPSSPGAGRRVLERSEFRFPSDRNRQRSRI